MASYMKSKEVREMFHFLKWEIAAFCLTEGIIKESPHLNIAHISHALLWQATNYPRVTWMAQWTNIYESAFEQKCGLPI